MEVIGWFFFDLLILGYVEDPATGKSFRIPGGLEWAIYVEVCYFHYIANHYLYALYDVLFIESSPAGGMSYKKIAGYNCGVCLKLRICGHIYNVHHLYISGHAFSQTQL